jgi:hypothetical protein
MKGGLMASAKFPVALRLSEREKEFAILVARGAKPADAYECAGYNESRPDRGAWRLLTQGNVQAAIALELGRMLQTEAAPTAYRVGLELMNNPKVENRVREGLVKTFLDRAGFPAARPVGQEAPGDKALHEMSGDDLRRYISRLESELADRAKVVVSVPESAGIEDQAINMFS